MRMFGRGQIGPWKLTILVDGVIHRVTEHLCVSVVLIVVRQRSNQLRDI